MTDRLAHILAAALILSSCSVVRHVERTVDVREPVFESIDSNWRLMAKVVALDAGIYPTEGNTVEIYNRGTTHFPLLGKEIQNAGESVSMEFYRFANDSIARVFRDLLCSKADSDSLRVRILMETRANPIDPAFYGRFRKSPNVTMANVQPLWDIPGSLQNFFIRNHRKITVIDDKVAYTGGVNVRQVYYNNWEDTQLRLTGPVVNSLNKLFSEDWTRFGKKRVQPYEYVPVTEKTGDIIVQAAGGDPYIIEKPIREGFEQAFAAAKDYIYIQTPYFCPPESTLHLMEKAVERGVDVRIILPEENDVRLLAWVNHSFYKRLLKSGVRIYHKQGAFLHRKSYVADDYVSCYGSANMDNRSYFINYENNVYIYNRNVALQSRSYFETLLAEQCRELSLDDTKWGPGELLMQWLTIALGYNQW